MAGTQWAEPWRVVWAGDSCPAVAVKDLSNGDRFGHPETRRQFPSLPDWERHLADSDFSVNISNDAKIFNISFWALAEAKKIRRVFDVPDIAERLCTFDR